MIIVYAENIYNIEISKIWKCFQSKALCVKMQQQTWPIKRAKTNTPDTQYTVIKTYSFTLVGWGLFPMDVAVFVAR